MVKQSAGLIMYRRVGPGVEVLLLHPGGPFWARKDDGAWTIPKGEIESGEEPLERRSGSSRGDWFTAGGDYRALRPVRLRSRKIVHAWAFEGDWDPTRIRSVLS